MCTDVQEESSVKTSDQEKRHANGTIDESKDGADEGTDWLAEFEECTEESAEGSSEEYAEGSTEGSTDGSKEVSISGQRAFGAAACQQVLRNKDKNVFFLLKEFCLKNPRASQ